MQSRLVIALIALAAGCGDPSSSVRDHRDAGAGAVVPPQLCGNGITEDGEDCDDGNRFDDDGCTNSCALARCGDGFVHIGQEDCDDGNRLDEDGCLNTCRAAYCGDGVLRTDLTLGGDGFEGCDDGNEADDDACLGACVAARCGDAIQRLDLAQDHPDFEVCDDGNSAEDDACLSNCRGARCGDGVTRRDRDQASPEFEACDDGNSVDDDACSSRCSLARCGDAIVRTDLHPSEPDGEACDDGNLLDTDACTSGCQAARCGDGIVRSDLAEGQPGYEDCDDGNQVTTDGCSNECRAPACGNGRLEPGERCDDGNRIDPDACLSNCLPARCGDGVLRRDLLPGALGYEACDDGNRVNSDACLNVCATARCGDGVRRTDLRDGAVGFEACDDGNRIDDDACASCRHTCFLHSNCPGGAGRCAVAAGARRGQCFDLRYHRCQSDSDCEFTDASDAQTLVECDRGLCRMREFAQAIVGIECALGNAVHNRLCLQPCRNHQECRKPYARCDATLQNHCWYNFCGRPNELSSDFSRQVNNGRLAGPCAGDHDNPLDGSCYEVGLDNNQWVGVCFEGGTLVSGAACRWGVRRDQDQLQCGGGLRCTGYDRAGLQHCRSTCNPPGGHGSVNCAIGSTCMPGLFSVDTFAWVCIVQAEQCDVISRNSCGDDGRCTVIETHSTTSHCSALAAPQDRVGAGAACSGNSQCPDGYYCHQGAGCSALCRSVADCPVGQRCSIAVGAAYGGCMPP